MNVGHLCMGCMANKGQAVVCPVCGWSEKNVPESPLHLPPREILNGRYLVGRVLGHGGFGVTYIAWDLNLQIRVAIKEYLPHNLVVRQTGKNRVTAYSETGQYYYQEGLAKFTGEARALARFNNHPGIVSVHNYFEENGTAYMVMDYLDGVTLKEYVRSKGGRIHWEEAILIMRQIIDSLQEVHSTGMLHRDITPENIKITSSGQVRLLDFGSARYALSQMTQTLTAIWTQGFAPAEQYLNKSKQGPWTDIYGVAATLYWAITSEVPPPALDRVNKDTLKPPTSMGLKVSPQFEKVLCKALEPKAEKRYQTMPDFGHALEMARIAQRQKLISSADNEPAKLTKKRLALANYTRVWQILCALLVALLLFSVGYWLYHLGSEPKTDQTVGNCSGSFVWRDC